VCKRRLTALITCNSTGTHKPKLFVIGTADQPRCFRNGIKATLPVTWKANNTAWMNTSLFYDWAARDFVPEVRAFKRGQGIPEDEKVCARGRGKKKNQPILILLIHPTPTQKKTQVLLLVDKFSGHKLEPQKHFLPDWLSIEFLAENTTSLIQPCDGGIIAKFKRVYRKSLLHRVLCEAAAGPGLTVDAFVKRINLLHAVQLMQKSWDAVTEADIAKVWRHTLMRTDTGSSTSSTSSNSNSSNSSNSNSSNSTITTTTTSTTTTTTTAAASTSSSSSSSSSTITTTATAAEPKGKTTFRPSANSWRRSRRGSWACRRSLWTSGCPCTTICIWRRTRR
jgi:hypothetical protein